MVRLTFLGAAETVTGSKYLVESDKNRILVDCGLFQGKKELRLRNWEAFPIDPATIQAIVLTHGHIDHIGYLPVLVRNGFRGPIFCTPATDMITKVLLADSAELQEEEAAYAQKAGSSKHKPPKPLYDRGDAKRTFDLLKVIPFGTFTEVIPGVKVLPRQAGHILGSANLSVEIEGKRISFSGDVGRYGMPILNDPEPLELGSVLLCEATYGDRVHGAGDLKSEILSVIKDTVSRNAPLIIPAFALGRTQSLLYWLAELEREGKIPALPVFVDSPMASEMTVIYGKYPENYNQEMDDLLADKISPLRTKRLQFCRTVQQSKEINGVRGPRIIIAGSGMVNGGRVLHHLSQNLANPDTTVLFVGYQAEGTRGALLQAGASSIRIFGREIPAHAHISTISGLSAHGDRNELLRWLKSCSGAPPVMRIVHAEEAPAKAFAQSVRDDLKWKVEVARQGEVLEV